jgi:hypothetical protein
MQASKFRVIPAMTTDAERGAYYRLAKQCAGKGEIIELGAWLGASTAAIAEGIRDSGIEEKARVYDRFQSGGNHAEKVETWYAERDLPQIPLGDCFEDFKNNLGDLIEFVEVNRGEISSIKWGNDPIALLVSDAPKRVPEISTVLTALKDGLQEGSLMAWQDFCHFPSYEIPACLFRLKDKVEFVEAIVPGTTMIFRVSEKLETEDVSRETLSLQRWTADEIFRAWDYWLGHVHPDKRALFRCGAAMFLCDIGEKSESVNHLSVVLSQWAGEVLPKWQYLYRVRKDMVDRYRPLFDLLEREGGLA